jgi:hypothetical protein
MDDTIAWRLQPTLIFCRAVGAGGSCGQIPLSEVSSLRKFTG